MIKIVICDDLKDDLDRVHEFVKAYVDERKMQAEIKVFNHPESEFVQCHESVCVNISAVDVLTKTDITVRNKELIPVSKSRYQTVAERYLAYRFD